METVVEDVEEEWEDECRPANWKCPENSMRCDWMVNDPICALHFNIIFWRYYYDHCQAKNKWHYSQININDRPQDPPNLENEYDGVVAQLLHKLWLMRPLRSGLIHQILKINLVEAIKREKYVDKISFHICLMINWNVFLTWECNWKSWWQPLKYVS